jgi:hypothetical protein
MGKLYITPKGRVLCDGEQCKLAVAAGHGADEVTGATAVTDEQAAEWFVTIGNLISCSVCGRRHDSGAIGQRERPKAR